MKTRTDSSHTGTDLSYPTKPDNKGYAKKWYAQRFYYFGLHNTAESFVLFGEWRKRLIETGEPPSVKELKAELRTSHPAGDEPSESVWPRVARYAAVALLAAAISSVATKTFSTPSDFVVDEEFGVITEDDRKILRGHRRFGDSLANVQTSHPGGAVEERIAARQAALMKGVKHGKDANTTGEGS